MGFNSAFKGLKYDFKKKKVMKVKCVFGLSLQLFINLSRTDRDMVENVYRNRCKIHADLARL